MICIYYQCRKRFTGSSVYCSEGCKDLSQRKAKAVAAPRVAPAERTKRPRDPKLRDVQCCTDRRCPVCAGTNHYVAFVSELKQGAPAGARKENTR